MGTYLALLRGINVSGHKMIKMDALKKALEGIGFTQVVTYIQSGNVFVDSNEDSPSKVGFLIKQEIFKQFGHDVPVIMVDLEELQACLDRNLFLQEPEVDLKKLYVSFISAELPENMITQLNLNFIKPDKIQLDGKRIYLKYDTSPAKTRLDNKWIEKNMNVMSTTRNWNTVNVLLKMFQDRV
jgi:uncharacterized protein (DUF1697 family)